MIVGGGPAGLATALELARRGIDALVVERSSYQNLRVGEHLQPSAVSRLKEMFSKFELSLDAHAASAGIDAYWGTNAASQTDYFFHPAQSGLNLSRPRFDADLARACETAGVTILRSASLTRASKRNKVWEVDVTAEGQCQTHRALIIVDATGRSACLGRRQGAQLRFYDRQIAMIGFGSLSKYDVDTRSTLEAVEIGWWYRAPIGAGRSVCFLTTDADLVPRRADSDLRSWWFEQLDRTARVARWSGDFSALSRLLIRSARTQFLDAPFGAGWLAVGDAALAFDPLSSLGIAKALDHAARVASTIAESLSGDAAAFSRFAVELRNDLSAYCAKRTAYYRLEMRWPSALFWRRRHGDLPQAPGVTQDPR